MRADDDGVERGGEGYWVAPGLRWLLLGLEEEEWSVFFFLYSFIFISFLLIGWVVGWLVDGERRWLFVCCGWLLLVLLLL
jgi:hypothetical protein